MSISRGALDEAFSVAATSRERWNCAKIGGGLIGEFRLIAPRSRSRSNLAIGDLIRLEGRRSLGRWLLRSQHGAILRGLGAGDGPGRGQDSARPASI